MRPGSSCRSPVIRGFTLQHVKSSRMKCAVHRHCNWGPSSYRCELFPQVSKGSRSNTSFFIRVLDQEQFFPPAMMTRSVRWNKVRTPHAWFHLGWPSGPLSCLMAVQPVLIRMKLKYAREKDALLEVSCWDHPFIWNLDIFPLLPSFADTWKRRSEATYKNGMKNGLKYKGRWHRRSFEFAWNVHAENGKRRGKVSEWRQKSLRGVSFFVDLMTRSDWFSQSFRHRPPFSISSCCLRYLLYSVLKMNNWYISTF